MTPEDLAKFCADEDEIRTWMQKPFSKGDHSYATNGHIIVRVPRLDGVDELDKNIILDKPFIDIGDQWFHPPSLPTLPEPYDVACPECDHVFSVDIDGCYSIQIGGLDAIQMRYARLICSLPNVELCKQSSPLGKIPFRFTGGEGSVMPLKGKNPRWHVEVTSMSDGRSPLVS